MDYLQTLNNIRALNVAATSQYWAYLNDVDHLAAGADLGTAIGKSWQAQVDAGDEQFKMLDLVLQAIAKNVPSDSMIETQALSEAAKNAQ